MKKNFGTIVTVLLIGFTAVLLWLSREKSSATNANEIVSKTAASRESPRDLASQATPRAEAPFIVQDTQNDSPGTNSVTRIVTLTAKIGSASPMELQWKVDKGNGFLEIPGATNSTYRIGNAQIGDTGLYALFGKNAFGEIHTTPTPLVIIEVED